MASLVFYAWGEGIYVLVMIASILLNYLFGRLMHYRPSRWPAKLVLVLGICCNLSILAFFKYFNFICDNLNVLFNWMGLPDCIFPPVHLPIGISFFTFQAMSYIMDVYRHRTAAQANLISLGLYISLFPQLIAGPIVRYNDIVAQLVARTVCRESFVSGIKRFTIGMGKKVLLANPMAAVADNIFSFPTGELTAGLAWLGAIAYSLQIYFDFSGYSDMAIGLGRMFGFKFLENFNYPYISRSVTEFWRRWHISLSTWLKDYLYIPLGGNRKGELRTYLNLCIVFLLCGLWHGAQWTFICWGAYHGLFLMLERTALGALRNRLWRPLQCALTLLIVVIGWVLFRSESIADAWGFLIAMFGLNPDTVDKYSIMAFLNPKTQFELILAGILCMPAYPYVQGLKHTLASHVSAKVRGRVDLALALAHHSMVVMILYASVISLAAGVYNPFIYFRF